MAIWSREATLTVNSAIKVSNLVGSPSKGARSVRLISGPCTVRGLTILAFAPGTCRIKVSIGAKKPFPALAITFDASTN